MPYAAKAKIEHEFETDHLNIWLTFRHPMDQTVKPPDELWLLEADAVAKTVSASAWQDDFTLLLTSNSIVTCPERVLLAYNGPNSNLQTTWGKDWEPWGPILSTDIGRAQGWHARDNPASDDFDQDDLIDDLDWHELDLSAIVPAGAKCVSMHIRALNTDVGKVIYLRQHGYTATFGTCSARIIVAGLDHAWYRPLGISTDRKIDYRMSIGGWTSVRFGFRGWWF